MVNLSEFYTREDIDRERESIEKYWLGMRGLVPREAIKTAKVRGYENLRDFARKCGFEDKAGELEARLMIL